MKQKFLLKTLLCGLICSAMFLSDGTSAFSAQTTTVYAETVTEVSNLKTSTNYHEITVTKSDASADAYKAIQAALDEANANATAAKPYKITVQPGTYTLSQSLHIYGNTYLSLEGVTLIQQKGVTTNMIKVGDAEDTKSGYYYKNITINGGVWDANGNSSTAIKAAHAKNFTMTNMVVQNILNAHLMEAAGIDGLTIKNCDFKDQALEVSADKLFYEAIQIDIPLESHIVGVRSEDLPMKNITIDKCTFNNVPRGIGSHTAILNSYVDNISITNCDFSAIKSAAIQSMNWINCTISGNTIHNVPRGIAIYSIRDEGTFLASTAAKEGGISSDTPTKYVAPPKDQNIVIDNNKITCGGVDPYADYEDTGILIGGIAFSKNHKGEDGDTIPAGDYYMSGVTVSNNDITTIGHGIRLEDTRNSTVTGNTIKYTGTDNKITYYGIQLRENSTSNKITKNTINKPQANGIFVYSGSSASAIEENEIISAGDHGIYIYSDSTVDSIANNEISKPKTYGINIDDATVKLVSKNTITSPGFAGVRVLNKGKADEISGNKITSTGAVGIDLDNGSAGSVNTNTISGSKSHDIYVHNKGTCTNIDSNTLSSAKKYSIFVDKVTVSTINNNKISSAGINAIYISNGGKATSVNSNVITSPGSAGININTKSTATNIKKNTISSSKTHGIYLHNTSTAKNIESNTIKSASKYAIFVEASTVTSLTKNKITSPKVTGIYVRSKATVKNIKQNTVSAPAKYGINVEKANVTSITKNTIKKPKSDAILVQSTAKSTAIEGNNLQSGNGNGIYVTRGTVTIADNKITSCKQAILISTQAKATVKENTLTKNKKNTVMVGSKVFKTVKAPTSVKAVKSGKNKIKVSWKKSSEATGYIVYRSTKQNSGYKKVATLKKTATSYIDKDVKAKKTYYYKILPIAQTTNGKITIEGTFSKVVSRKL